MKSIKENLSNRGKTPQVTCLGITCGKVVELPQHVDPAGYDGDIRCQECRSLLHIKLEGSRVVRYSLKEDRSKEILAQKRDDRLTALLEKPSQRH